MTQERLRTFLYTYSAGSVWIHRLCRLVIWKMLRCYRCQKPTLQVGSPHPLSSTIYPSPFCKNMSHEIHQQWQCKFCSASFPSKFLLQSHFDEYRVSYPGLAIAALTFLRVANGWQACGFRWNGNKGYFLVLSIIDSYQANLNGSMDMKKP